MKGGITIGKINTLTIRYDASTGEEIGRVVRTAEQNEAYLRKKQKIINYEARGYCMRKQSEELGGFIWLIYNACEALDLGLKPDELTKLIFLSTYMNYKNCLAVNNSGNKEDNLTREDVFKLLKVKERKFREFWINVKAANILTENKDQGCIKLNEDIFHKGSIANIDIDKRAVRLYAAAVRELYNKADAREHKFLSYLYQAIPFINLKYNILCTNPDEEDRGKVNAINLTSYCKIVGYCTTSVSRFKVLLKQLSVKGEHVFGFTDNGDGKLIYINPRIYYGGNDYDDVRAYGNFFVEGGNDR